MFNCEIHIMKGILSLKCVCVYLRGEAPVFSSAYQDD